MAAAGSALTTAEATPYNEDVIRWFTVATMFWGIVGFSVGVWIAFELAFPVLNLGLEWTSFGRLRPVHTSAVIFAFGGNALLGTSLYVVQRTCRAPLFGGRHLATFLFWGYQLFIVLAAIGYVTGVTESQRICRARMVHRHLAHDRLGGLSRRLLRDDPEAQGAAHLRGELVLPRLHRHDRDAAHRQQSLGSGLDLRHQELLALLRRPGCADPVVVRPQRRGLLPHRRLPRHDVLLRAQAGRAARSTPTASRSSTSGRLSFSTSGPGRITSTTRPCRIGRRCWA